MKRLSGALSKIFRVVFSWKVLLAVPVILIIVSCSGESDEFARKKLDTILKDDLSAILEGVSDSALIDNPRYELVFYKTYDEGNYSKKAIADFYFMKKIPVKIVRKYRYHVKSRMWDRYYNEYSFINDSAKTEKGE